MRSTLRVGSHLCSERCKLVCVCAMQASHRNSADGVGVVFVPSGTHSAAREECSCGDVLPVHFQSAVNHMMEMGFFDQPRIVRLLHKHGGDEQMVVDELCRQGGATAEAD